MRHFLLESFHIKLPFPLVQEHGASPVTMYTIVIVPCSFLPGAVGRCITNHLICSVLDFSMQKSFMGEMKVVLYFHVQAGS